MTPSNPKKPKNRWIALINIPIQMGITIFAFAYLGNYLDNNNPHSTIIYKQLLGLIGVFVSIYIVIKEVKKLNNE